MQILVLCCAFPSRVLGLPAHPVLQEKGYVTADVAKEQDLHQLKLSGTKFRQLLRSGADIPDWFAFKSVVDVLREATPTTSD